MGQNQTYCGTWRKEWFISEAEGNLFSVTSVKDKTILQYVNLLNVCLESGVCLSQQDICKFVLVCHEES